MTKLEKVVQLSNTKPCSRCKQILPITDFGVHRKTKDGHYSQCLPCHREARAAYRKRQAEAIKLQQRDNYERNRAKRIAYANKRIADNPEMAKIYNARSKKRNHLAIAADTRRRNARRKANGIFAISKKELLKLSQQSCFYCGSTERLTVDHIIAIARGGRDSIGNLVSACKSCNSQKRDLTIMEWRIKKDRQNPYADSDGLSA
jgi:5-methylcytosine-specific restriction endonuclease McrA